MKPLKLKPIAKVIAEDHLPKARIYQLLKTGELEGRKVGKLTYIIEASLNRWKRSLPPYKPLSQRSGDEVNHGLPPVHKEQRPPRDGKAA